MKDETGHFLRKARSDLADAHAILSIGLTKVAARCAYYAAFHAAEAMIFEWTGKVAKTHSGVRSELARLGRDDERIDPGLHVFLAQAYRFKQLSDYGTDDDAVLDRHQAMSLVTAAGRFIDTVAARLSPL